jgi:adenylate cyclase
MLSLRGYLLIFVFTLGCVYEPPQEKAEIKEGVLILNPSSFDKSHFLSLEGEWQFFFNLLPEQITTGTPSQWVLLPGHWNRLNVNGKALEGSGLATYRLKVIIPKDTIFPPLAVLTSEQDTSHAIYIDGKFLGGSGRVGLTDETTKSQVRSSVVILPILPNTKELQIDLVVANFSHRKGGAWNDVLLAPYENAQQRLTRAKMKEMMIASVLCFVGIFFFAFYLMERRSAHALGIFAFCFIVLLRNITTGERILLEWLDLPYSIVLRLEYLSWFWAAPILTRYFQAVFPFDFPSKFTKYFYIISAILSLTLLFPSIYFTETASVYPFFFIINGAFIFYSLFQSYKNKRTESTFLVTGAILLLLGAINDTLHAQSIIHTAYIGPLTVVIFVLLQVFTFGLAIKQNLKQTKEMTKDLIGLNASYSRFLPQQFLKFLGREDIRELKLGEQVQKKMTVLFADIRAFTEFSESLTPKENFDFLNAYLQRVGPIIRHNNGFIDKFIGDAIMALFPNHPDDAIRASVQMQNEIRLYNEYRAISNYQPIKVGIGLHTGNLILGILGEHERMECTVISDAVNLASRIEGVTKQFGAEIVISADTFIEATEKLGYDYRLLDRVAIKGKSESVYVVEVLNGYDAEKYEALLSKKEDYVFALEAFRRHDYTEAHELFLEILNAIPQDNVSRIFLQNCERHLESERVDT